MCCLYSNTFLCLCQWFCTHSCVENRSCLSVSKSAQFRTRRASPPAPAPSRFTRRGLSGIECRPVQRVQRPGVCVGARSAVGVVCPGTCPPWYLARPALLSVLCNPSGCAGGWGFHRRGMGRTPGVGQVMPANSEAQEKGVFPVYPPPFSLCKTPPPTFPILKISRKNKKTPTKGLCSVLYLPYKP